MSTNKNQVRRKTHAANGDAKRHSKDSKNRA